jgi:arabinogalactan endo-1,4-beta-galactosidase
VSTSSDNTKVLLHFAGMYESSWFFNQVNVLDYNIIGLPYCLKWHGKPLNNLKNKMHYLSETYNKEVWIAETAYPFKLEWNDWINNIVSLDKQFILPGYPASIEGQRQFIN